MGDGEEAREKVNHVISQVKMIKKQQSYAK
jgi:hypothetical protein